MMRESARVVATELIRRPVKEAVREALREETSSIRSASGTSESDVSSEKKRSEGRSSQRSTGSDRADSKGGRSKLTSAAFLLAIAGIAFLARRRMSSTGGSAWSEPSAGDVASDDAEGGYVSEGEMQTAETSGESGTDTEGSGTSPSTATDQ